MANVDKAFGARPVLEDGSVARVREYSMTSGTAIFKGDFVKLEAAGTVTVAAAGDVLLGVAAESKASTDSEILVYDHPFQLYYIQSSGSTVAADVGQNAEILANAADTALSRSKHELDQSTQVPTAAQLKILALAAMEGNEFGANAKLLVQINEHFRTEAAGI